VKTAQAKLAEFKKQLQAELDKAAKEIGDTPSDAQKQELARRQAVANQRWAIAKRNTDAQVRARRDAALAGFREEVSPIAGRVARKRGMSVVLTKALPVLWSDGAVDITDDVLAEVNKLRAAGQFGTGRRSSPEPAAPKSGS